VRIIPWREDRLDRWTFVHCFGCTFLTVLFAYRLSPWLSGVLAFCLAVDWELCDMFLGERFPSIFDRRGLSWKDLIADAIGTALGILFLPQPAVAAQAWAPLFLRVRREKHEDERR
jgi:hypothetical protein